MNQHLFYWLSAAHLHGIGPQRFLKLLEFFGDIKHLFDAEIATLRELNLEEKTIATLKKPNRKIIDEACNWAENPLHHIIYLQSSLYPEVLKTLPDPPLLLFVKGNLAALNTTQIAIVGAREASIHGIKNATTFANELCEANVTVTSGLARGIDAASHRGALANNGITIAVAGTGLNTVYPKSHKTLVEEIIAKNGAIVSEFPLDVPAHPFNFPRRNRIIAGLTRGVLVIEAAIKSGSLITAQLALEQNREVFAVPGSIHYPLAKGCHYLIKQGAHLVECAKDILDLINWDKTFQVKKAISNLTITSVESQMLNYIRYEITPIDVIVLQSRLTAGEVSSILLTLELKGLIESVPGGYCRK